MRSTLVVIVAGVLFAVTELPTLSAAQSNTGAQLNAETLRVISDFAETNCPTPAPNGSHRIIEGSAELQTKLANFLKYLTDVGTTLKGDAKSSTYYNVTQEKLAEALK